MTHNVLPPHPNSAGCAGQGCPERSGCLRYLRPAIFAFKRKDGSWVTQKWASYDIERVAMDEVFGRSCPHRHAPIGQIARALADMAA